MHVGIYSPYLDSVGGGERYILTIAEFLSGGNKADIFLDSNLQKTNLDDLKHKLQESLDLDLSGCNFIPAPFGLRSSYKDRDVFLKKYDVLFAVTDGSIFYSSAKKSFL